MFKDPCNTHLQWQPACLCWFKNIVWFCWAKHWQISLVSFTMTKIKIIIMSQTVRTCDSLPHACEYTRKSANSKLKSTDPKLKAQLHDWGCIWHNCCHVSGTIFCYCSVIPYLCVMRCLCHSAHLCAGFRCLCQRPLPC